MVKGSKLTCFISLTLACTILIFSECDHCIDALRNSDLLKPCIVTQKSGGARKGLAPGAKSTVIRRYGRGTKYRALSLVFKKYILY